ncbi:adenosine receptor A3-like isoform X1 [Haliotis rufescens]|uniref:adenosine receptor A3-like isoform X1 n=1 Tax=Haliotis rufescens TaxID=6454 RepID=UPI00201E7D1A|nr:adenosine receptor A3-like isoform X1 [Haliotis rufescens]
MSNTTEGSSYILFRTFNDRDITLVTFIVNIVIFIIGFLALSLNAIVLDTLVKRGNLEPTDLVMCHLAATDMLTGILIIHTVGYNLIYFQNTIECLIRIGAVFIFISSSVYHLSLLTGDRFVKIVFPYRYQDVITRKSVSIMSAAIWVFSVNLGLLPSYGWRDYPPPSEPPCSFLGVLHNGFLRFGLVVFLFPVFVIAILYSKIFMVARRHARAIAATDVAGSKKESSSMKFTKTVVILIGTYLVSFLPMAMVALVFTFGGFHEMSASDVGDYIVYASVLTFANSLVNPIIYAFKLPPVRRRLLRFLGKGDNSSNSATNGTVQTIVTDMD